MTVGRVVMMGGDFEGEHAPEGKVFVLIEVPLAAVRSGAVGLYSDVQIGPELEVKQDDPELEVVEVEPVARPAWRRGWPPFYDWAQLRTSTGETRDSSKLGSKRIAWLGDKYVAMGWTVSPIVVMGGEFRAFASRPLSDEQFNAHLHVHTSPWGKSCILVRLNADGSENLVLTHHLEHHASR